MRWNRSGLLASMFHDLRHTGNQFAANSGAALKDLMARMGHDSERAALIYQHEARGADKRITDAIDFHVQAERDDQGDDDEMVRLGRWSRLANCTLIARRAVTIVNQQGPASGTMALTWAFAVERVTGIEPALSAWEADVLPLNYTRADLQLSRREGELRCVRPDIVPEPVGCQGAPLRS